MGFRVWLSIEIVREPPRRPPAPRSPPKPHARSFSSFSALTKFANRTWSSAKCFALTRSSACCSRCLPSSSACCWHNSSTLVSMRRHSARTCTNSFLTLCRVSKKSRSVSQSLASQRARSSRSCWAACWSSFSFASRFLRRSNISSESSPIFELKNSRIFTFTACTPRSWTFIILNRCRSMFALVVNRCRSMFASKRCRSTFATNCRRSSRTLANSFLTLPRIPERCRRSSSLDFRFRRRSGISSESCPIFAVEDCSRASKSASSFALMASTAWSWDLRSCSDSWSCRTVSSSLSLCFVTLPFRVQQTHVYQQTRHNASTSLPKPTAKTFSA